MKKMTQQNRKPYAFNGWENPAIRPVDLQFAAIESQHELYDLLSSLWCRNTCAPRMQDEWSPENKTKGQCSITAFLAQDIFGGDVCGIPLPDGNFHCYNVIGDVWFDLTSEQFEEKAKDFDYSSNPVQSRKQHFSKAEKKARYEMLKHALIRSLEECR